MLGIDSEVHLKTRRTRIVATIGPASSSEALLRELMLAGMNIARLNFSHGTHGDHLAVIERLRKVSAELGKHISLLGDLCGPKIRVGMFESGEIPMPGGEIVEITTEPVTGRPGLIPSQYPALVQDVLVGQRILFDDGRLEAEVVSKESPTLLKARVIRGGTLKNKKGINLPESKLSTPALTEKDREDLRFCVEQDLDYVALSFVRAADEILDLKRRIEELSDQIGSACSRPVAEQPVMTRVIAKIEKPEALADITRIVEAADGIMVARGDLGVELLPQKVPIIQSQLIQLANQHQKPVIVATQMMESMIESPQPTRAEVSDVANAVFAHTDAVMLSAESASGKYPVESVRAMDSVLREVESYQWSKRSFGKLKSEFSVHPLSNAVSRACTLLSTDLEIHTINVLTRTGRTARLMSASRPAAPIFAYSMNPKIVRQMAMYWGVEPVLIEEEYDAERLAVLASKKALERDLAAKGQYILLTSSFHLSGQSNNIIIYPIE